MAESGRISAEKKTAVSTAPIRAVAAALPYVVRDGRRYAVLVTSRNTKRWVPPKGRIEAGETASQCAKREALEEAGVIGKIGRDPIAFLRGDSTGAITIPLFLLEVTEVLESWAESGERERIIETPSKLALSVDDPGLISALLMLAGPVE